MRRIFSGDFSGHDLAHTERVHRNAMEIARYEPCDSDIVALAALLHDVDDPKLFCTENYANARRIMAGAGIDSVMADRVVGIISKVSFKGTDTEVPDSIEGRIVQDADRLDALGAVGIARAFAYGGSHGRELYNPDIPPHLSMDEAAYRLSNGTTVNHFYEKLLLLKNMMNTEYARTLAEKRTRIMEDFLAEFLAEWDGKA